MKLKRLGILQDVFVSLKITGTELNVGKELHVRSVITPHTDDSPHTGF